MEHPNPTPRRSWFDSIPWWLWAAIAVTNAPLVFFRLGDFFAGGSSRAQTEAALMAAQAAVWCLLASLFAVKAWQGQQLRPPGKENPGMEAPPARRNQP